MVAPFPDAAPIARFPANLFGRCEDLMKFDLRI